MREMIQSETVSAFSFLDAEGGSFLSIAWTKQLDLPHRATLQFVEEVLGALCRLEFDPDSFVMFGAVVLARTCSHDQKYSINRPRRVQYIVGGHEKMVLLLIMNVCLHQYLTLHIHRLDVSHTKSSAAEWLFFQVLRSRDRLARTLEIDMDYSDGDAIYQWYPKMIRAYDDSWSRNPRDAQYDSAVAKFLREYSIFYREELEAEAKKRKPRKFSLEGADEARIVEKNRALIVKIIEQIAKGQEEEGVLDFPPLKLVAEQKTNFQTSLFNAEFPKEVVAKLMEADSPDEDEKFLQVFRVVLFANYLLDRVAITVITAKNESYAFDVFEALNTTGTPLTAFEIFKPYVIQAETLQQYEHSPAYGYVRQIEDYLRPSDASGNKQVATSSLLIPFRMSDDGKRLSKRLSDQRNYLNMRYKAQKDVEDKREFLKELSYASMFMALVWRKDNHRLELHVPIEDDSVKVCLHALVQANHDIVIGLLLRYYSDYLDAGSADKATKRENLYQAIRAVVAFLVLWRGYSGTTDGIDTRYRKLMGGDYEPLTQVGALAKDPKDKVGGFLEISGLKKVFKHILTAGDRLPSKEDWIYRSCQVGIYDKSLPITRLMLMMALEDSSVSSVDKGHVEKGRKGLLSVFNYKNWAHESLTVEHIAPQKTEQWDHEIYKQELTDTIGNLILLPRNLNSSASNRSWEYKKMLYMALAAETEEAQKQAIHKAIKNEVVVGTGTEDLLSQAKHLPYLRALSQLEGNFDAEFVRRRSEVLLGFVWDAAMAWL